MLTLIVAATSLPALAAQGGSQEAEPRARSRDPQDLVAFLGLWEGIDRLDGSTVQVSLSDIEGDGIVELIERESFFTFCFDNGPNYSQGRGLITGTGTVTRKGELVLETLFTCIDDSGEAAPSGPPGSVTYTLQSHDKMLLLPDFDEAPAIMLHRISQ